MDTFVSVLLATSHDLYIPLLDPKPVYTWSPAPVSSDLGADVQDQLDVLGSMSL